MTHVFGPIPSRRLGLSLGIDLIPSNKVCTYDCLYCQVGRTVQKTVTIKPLVDIREVIDELKNSLKKIIPDVITFSGSGEPTLHSEIDQVIDYVKTITNTKIALLTNGSLLWREDVRNRITGADIVIPTLSTVFEETFKTIHRPHEALDLTRIIEGLKYFRQIYKGKIFLEVVLLAGLNQSSKEIEGLKGVIDEISPDRIQLNTVVRPPADSRAIPLDKRGLEDIKDYFGENADIITSIPFKQKEGQYNSLIDTVLEMARRRPIKAMDVAHALNMGLEEIEGIIKGLLIKGSLHQQEHSGEVFYVKAHGAKQMI